MSDLDWKAAREKVLAGVAPLAPTRVPLLEAHGRVLAEAIPAREPLPGFDHSAMDGFAVVAMDLAGATEKDPVELRVIGLSRAGGPEAPPVEEGTTVRIMTGAPVPPGADAVVPLEHTDLWDPSARRSRNPRATRVQVQHPAITGQHIRRRGEAVAAGAELLGAGQRLDAASTALLLSGGVTLVNVHPLPRVGVLSTGDELVDSGKPLQNGQIRDSNRPALLLRLAELGLPAVDLGRVADDADALADRLRTGAGRVDFLLTSGGVSVGDFDLTRTVLDRIGDVEAYAVRVKPGKPQVFGHLQGTPVFGLPGNPVSSLVVFEMFVLPALRRMAGRRDPLPPIFLARLAAPLRRKAGRVEFLRVSLAVEDGTWHATPTGPQGSGRLRSMTDADGYAIIPTDVESLEPGAPVECLFRASR